MRKNASKLLSLTMAALLTISALFVFAPSAKANPATTMEIIANEGLAIGSHDSNFTSSLKNLGDTFTFNISVYDVTDLQLWQVHVQWDPTVLQFVSISIPTDNVFSPSGKSLIAPPPDEDPDGGGVAFGATYINDPYWTFNSTDYPNLSVLCQVTVQIVKAVNLLNRGPIFSAISLVGIGTETFMTNGASPAGDISFSAVNGRFFNKWIVPGMPTIYIKPSVEKPDKINDVFGLEIWVRDVDPNWNIIGFQFSIMWNTTFIVPTLNPSLSGYFDPGTFLEAFQYYPDGVLYVADVNTHNRPPPLTAIPDAYNYSMFGAMLLPDNPPADPFHAPWPSVGSGGAKLMTVYFQAIYETISPVEDWTLIPFITFLDFGGQRTDTFAMTQFLTIININTEPCTYRAPLKVLGLSIDLYTQYDSPEGGQGANQPSDMFGPQQLVDLFAIVTYNEYPVQQKLVGFHITHNGYDIYREATTDANGFAHVSFRLPWPCVDPVDEIFGKWFVIATVEVAEQVKNDTLAFWVYWKVVILSVEPKHTQYIQQKQGGTNLDFTVLYGTYSMQTIPLNLTVTVYDELGFFVGSALLSTTVGWGEYKYYDYMACEPAPFLEYPAWEPVIPLPTNAVVGKGMVFANAFDNLPWNGGTPYCPEVTNTIDFYIVKPP